MNLVQFKMIFELSTLSFYFASSIKSSFHKATQRTKPYNETKSQIKWINNNSIWYGASMNDIWVHNLFKEKGSKIEDGTFKHKFISLHEMNLLHWNSTFQKMLYIILWKSWNLMFVSTLLMTWKDDSQDVRFWYFCK